MIDEVLYLLFIVPALMGLGLLYIAITGPKE